MVETQAEKDRMRGTERTAKEKGAGTRGEATRKAHQSESRYRFLYELSPFPLVEMDCSELPVYLEALRAKGARDLRAYLTRHTEALVECAEKIKLLEVNNAFVQMFDAGSKAAVLKKGLELFPRESFDSFCEGIVAYAEGRDSFECELEAQTFTGKRTVLYLRWAVIPSDGGSRTRMLGSLIDITERKEMFDELTVFKSAADLACFGNAITDIEGNFIYVNKAFADMHGFAMEELQGQHFRIVHTEEQMQAIRRLSRDMEEKSAVNNVEIWHRKKDGTVFPTQMTAVLVKDADGRVLCSYASTVDTSELKQAESDLWEREKDLEEKNIRLEEMNAALKVLLQSREADKNEVEEKVVKNVKELSLPMVEKLQNSGLDAKQKAYLDVLESSLQEIISPFVRDLASHYPGLTPAELTIANLIKEGKDSKEVAEMLNLSKRSVDTYRNRIRNKLGLTNKKVNLRTHLLRLR